MLHDHLSKLNDLIDPDHLTQAEARMAAAVGFDPVDRLPLAVNCPVPGWPTFSYHEGFRDMGKMLLNELNQVWIGAHVRDDRMYTIRANYGVGIVASMFGCVTVLMDENSMPWAMPLTDDKLNNVLDRGQVDISAGLGSLVLKTERFYLQVLSGYENLARCVRVFVCDTQGPFDIAHLVMGHKIYTEIYDNPARVHRLLELCTDAYVRFTKAQKEIIGENGGWSYHSQMKVRGAARLCDDSGINLSAACYREFSKPYNERAFAELGGGWIHYCGDGHQILPEVLSTQGVTGINFGNPERQDIGRIYSEAAGRRIAVLGWPKEQGIPEGVTTGMTLGCQAADLDAARRNMSAQ